MSAQAELDRARQTFDDVLIALGMDYNGAQMIRAAASSWAKAQSAATIAHFIESRRAAVDKVGLN